MLLTFLGVGQVCDSLGHDDGNINVSTGLIHPQLEKYMVQEVFHNIPVADNAGPSLESIANMAARGCVSVAIIAGQRERLAKLSVAVFGRYWR